MGCFLRPIFASALNPKEVMLGHTAVLTCMGNRLYLAGFTAPPPSSLFKQENKRLLITDLINSVKHLAARHPSDSLSPC